MLSLYGGIAIFCFLKQQKHPTNEQTTEFGSTNNLGPVAANSQPQPESNVEKARREFNDSKKRSAAVKWLEDNFEMGRGDPLRKKSVYKLYQHHCKQQSITSVSDGFFGKIIKEVFEGIQSERLGPR